MIEKYERLRSGIVYLIQNSELDVGAAYFVLKDVFRDIELVYQNQVSAEILQEKGKDGCENG